MLSRYKKPIHITLKIMSMLSLSRFTHWFLIIFSKIFFIIDKCIIFYFENILFFLSIISAIYNVSKALRLK